MSLYDDPAIQGRRGVVPLNQSIKIIRKKQEDREKFEKLTEKYG